MSFSTLAALLGLMLIGWAWYANLAARELANRVAAETCATANVQLLDGTVSSLKTGLARDGAGRLTLRRTYVFDYSEDGFSRHRGFVVLSGMSVDSVGLGPRAVS